MSLCSRRSIRKRRRSHCLIWRAARARRPQTQQYSTPGRARIIAAGTMWYASISAAPDNRIVLRFFRKKTPTYYLSEMYPVDYVTEMRHALEQRADLTKYTTSIAMDDLDDVRTWLGYDRINLFGASYGTQAALVYMRRHPENVRSAILLAVAPADLKMPLHHSESAARAMDLLFGECEQDATCHAAFPQIRDDWNNVLAQLEKQPAHAEYSPPNN